MPQPKSAARPQHRLTAAIASRDNIYTRTKLTPQDLRAGLEQSLRGLGTEYVHVDHLHALRLSQPDFAVNAPVRMFDGIDTISGQWSA